MSFQNAMHRSRVSWQPFCAATPVHSRVHCKLQQDCGRKQRQSSRVVNISQSHSGEKDCLHQRRAESSQASSQVQHQPITPAKPATQKQKLHQSNLGLALTAALLPLQQDPAVAFTIRQEPDNALSFPTWVIHISSVLEWAIAMALVWKYAEVTGGFHHTTHTAVRCLQVIQRPLRCLFDTTMNVTMSTQLHLRLSKPCFSTSNVSMRRLLRDLSCICNRSSHIFLHQRC